jgi:hypothetical protein
MEDGCMKAKLLSVIAVILAMGASMNAEAGLFGLGGTSWKEEVLLHDGTKIVVERTIDRGGRHEIGQQPPIKSQSLTLILSTTNERVTWKSEYSEDVGYADLKPILLGIVQGTAYVVTTPVGCLAYNKWKRPNPPYIFLKFLDYRWQQIELQDLPAELKIPNLIISSPDNEVEKLGKSFVTAADIAKLNSSLTQPEYRTILREPVLNGDSITNCEVLVRYKCGWGAPGEFNRKYFERTCK